MSIFEKLKEARTSRAMKQSEVAQQLGCAATSLTNWESGRVMPSLDILAKLCDIYEVSPLSLLDREYSYFDIVGIAEKPIPDRSYDEQVALNFSYPILNRLMAAEAQRQESARVTAIADFLRENAIMERFEIINAAGIDAVRREYETNAGADKDILFAFHAMTTESKRAFLSMLSGLLTADGNTQSFGENMNVAIENTAEKLRQMRSALRE